MKRTVHGSDGNILYFFKLRCLNHLHIELGEGEEGCCVLRVMLEGLLVQLNGSFILPLVSCVFCHLCTHAEGRKKEGVTGHVILYRQFHGFSLFDIHTFFFTCISP